MRSREGYFCVYIPNHAATREIIIKKLELAPKQFVTNVHTLFYFLHHRTNPWMTIKNDNLHTSTPCLTRSVFVLVMTSQSIADNITMTRQLWHNHVQCDIWLVRYRFNSWPYSRLACTNTGLSKVMLNSLWPSDVIWRQGSMSTLAQVVACCLTAPSHYLNQCWLMISDVLYHAPENNFTENS